MKIIKSLIKNTPLEPFARSLNGYFMNDWRYTKVDHGYKHIVVACFPKSGSTYTSNVLSNVQGLKKVSLVPGYRRREQELDLNALIRLKNKNYVAQHHLKLSDTTEEIIKKFRLTPIVLTRNIFDIIISFKDHIRKEPKNLYTSMAFISDHLLKLDDPDLELALAELLSPWYFNFFVSWSEYPHKLHMTYEQLITDKNRFFEEIFDYCGIDSKLIVSDTQIFENKGQNSRFNKGIVGRGEKLDSRAKDHILKISKYYPGVNLKAMGL